MADPQSLLQDGGFVAYTPHKPEWHDPPSGTDRSPLSTAKALHDALSTRRSVRFFSPKPIDRAVIETLIMTASSAPSGANKQPWRFVAISDPIIKRQIRIAAEHEEREFYSRRATPEWLADLAPLGTDSSKPFLETAPWLIVAFKLMETDEGGNVYYPTESIGIACGFLIAAIHHAGLATLTHTPSPMGFLSRVLQRPAHERPFLLLPVGYPTEDAVVPVITKKTLEQVSVWHTGESTT
ncbi:MAG: nitroreductase family protein [Planctomycetes bacterium]|nr:nitroreductase family protein [Planctomycetota bacterium]